MLALRRMLNRLGQRLVIATAEPSQPQYTDGKPAQILGLELKGGSLSFPDHGRVEARRVTQGEWSVTFERGHGDTQNHGILPFADALRKMHEVHMAEKAIRCVNRQLLDPTHFWTVEEPLQDAPANNLYKVAARYGIALEGAPEVKLAAAAASATHPRAAA